ncbi:hypothetical protein Taro_039814, partial [Colocasia esculenta]|nr:hypothetical protein [Colocasia esculenta]
MPGTSRDPGPGSLESDDTDLDGTTQVPGQSPELTAWLTKNLGHPTEELSYNDPKELTGFVPYLRMHLNLLNSSDSHQTPRKLLRQLHHVPAFPYPIRHRLVFHDLPIILLQPLEALGKQGHEIQAREREKWAEETVLGQTYILQVAQVGVNMDVANQTAKARRTYPLSPSSYSKRQHIWTSTSQRPHLAANSYSTAAGTILFQDPTCTTPAHTTRPNHIGLTMAIT